MTGCHCGNELGQAWTCHYHHLAGGMGGSLKHIPRLKRVQSILARSSVSAAGVDVRSGFAIDTEAREKLLVITEAREGLYQIFPLNVLQPWETT